MNQGHLNVGDPWIVRTLKQRLQSKRYLDVKVFWKGESGLCTSPHATQPQDIKSLANIGKNLITLLQSGKIHSSWITNGQVHLIKKQPSYDNRVEMKSAPY